MKFPTKLTSALAVALLAVSALALPALARDSFVLDGAGMLGATTVSALNEKISDFNRATGKEVVVVTVATLNGTPLNDAVEHTFAEKQVNGVLIFIAKAEKKYVIVGDRASRAFFPAGTFATIHDAMRPSFQNGNFDEGVTTGVNLVLAQYRSHQSSLTTRTSQLAVPAAATGQSMGGRGFMSLIWLGLILLAGFLIIRAIFRAIFGSRQMMPPGYGQGGPMMGGPPMGGMGYGGGYGGGGGGSFFSGLLGGLGGAFLGNELFGRRDQGFGGGDAAGMVPGASVDSSGWQSDAGQVDMGNAGSGGWGDSGGGFDSGGGGGFDGGGGGDGGGGW